MRKLFTAAITAAGIIVISASAAGAAGQVLSTDIGTVIDGAACRTYNVDGRTFVVAEELGAYGFDVDYDNSKRQLSISQNLHNIHWLQDINTTNILKSECTVGEPLMDMIDTDITVNIGGENTEAYAIDGQMVIPVRALGAFGEVNFDAEKKIVSVDLIPGYYKKRVNTMEKQTVIVDRNFRYIKGDNDEIIYGYRENDLLMDGTKIQNIKANDAYVYGYEILSEAQVYDAVWPLVNKEYWDSEFFTDIFAKTSVNTTELFVHSRSGNLYRFYTPTGYISPEYSGVYRVNAKSWGGGMVVANDGILYKETDRILAPNRWRCHFDEIVAYNVEKVSENCILYNNGDVYIQEEDTYKKIASGMSDVISIEGSDKINKILMLSVGGTAYFGTKEDYINDKPEKLSLHAKNIFAKGSVVDEGEIGYVESDGEATSFKKGKYTKLMDNIEKIVSIDYGIYITSDGRLIKKQGDEFETIAEDVIDAYYYHTELGLYPPCLYFIKSDGSLNERSYNVRASDGKVRRITVGW